MASTLPNFASPPTGISFTSSTGLSASAPTFVSNQLSTGQYLITGRKGSTYVLLVYNADGSIDSTVNGLGYLTAPTGATFDPSRAPVAFCGGNNNSSALVSGLISGTSQEALFSYKIENDWFGNTWTLRQFGLTSSLQYVPLPSGFQISGGYSSDGWSITIAGTLSGSSILYNLSNNQSPLWSFNSAFGISGKIIAPAGYTFTGLVGTTNIISSSGNSSITTQLVLYSATNIATGSSVLLSYNNTAGSGDPTKTTTTRNTSLFGASGVLSIPLDYNITNIQSLTNGVLLLSATQKSTGKTVGFAYTSNGNLNTTFGTNGRISIPSGTTLNGVNLVLSDGSLILGGTLNATKNNEKNSPIFVHYSSSGTLDTNFSGGSGYITLPETYIIDNEFCTVGTNLLIGVYYNYGSSQGWLGYNSNGTPSSFGGGLIASPPNITFQSGSYPPLSDGSVMFLVTQETSHQWGLVHLLSNGQFDLNRGFIPIPSGYSETADFQSFNGSFLYGVWNGSEQGLAHYYNNGELDKSFGSGGVLTAPVGSSIYTTSTGYTIDASVLKSPVNLSADFGCDNLIGGAFNDTFVGNGSSTLIGGAGSNTYIVSSANDRIIDTGSGSVIRSAVNFNLSSSLVSGVNNLVYTGLGNPSLSGNTLSNSIAGGSGNDTLSDGGGGMDTLNGGAGSNTYIVSSTNDRIIDTGSGSVIRSAVNFNLSSSLVSGVNNLVYTGSTNASLIGNSNSNYLTAVMGNDTLQGFASGTAASNTTSDTLSGGATASDLFVMAATNDTNNAYGNGHANTAVLYNFIGGSGGDTLQLHNFGGSYAGATGYHTLSGGAGVIDIYNHFGSLLADEIAVVHISSGSFSWANNAKFV